MNPLVIFTDTETGEETKLISHLDKIESIEDVIASIQHCDAEWNTNVVSLMTGIAYHTAGSSSAFIIEQDADYGHAKFKLLLTGIVYHTHARKGTPGVYLR